MSVHRYYIVYYYTEEIIVCCDGHLLFYIIIIILIRAIDRSAITILLYPRREHSAVIKVSFDKTCFFLHTTALHVYRRSHRLFLRFLPGFSVSDFTELRFSARSTVPSERIVDSICFQQPDNYSPTRKSVSFGPFAN